MFEFIRGLLVVVDIIVAILLIGIILIQKSKSDGMGGLSFGAGMGEALFGSRTGNVLTRGTITLAIVFLSCTVILGMMSTHSAGAGSVLDRSEVEAPAQAPQQTAPPAATAPVAPAPAAAPMAPVAAPVAPMAPIAPMEPAPVAPATTPAPAP